MSALRIKSQLEELQAELALANGEGLSANRLYMLDLDEPAHDGGHSALVVSADSDTGPVVGVA